MLEVPKSLNRNAKWVQELGDPADTGLMLINYMCARIGIDSLTDLDVLDFGCGVRFSQTIINRDMPIGTYVGLDVEKTIIDFLNNSVQDPRFSYYHLDTLNLLYNPNGQALDAEHSSVLGDAKFDVACMFSVITHQQPEEAIPIFHFLRRHIKFDGYLFFSAFIHEGDVAYKELDPETPGLRSSYSFRHMTELCESANWSMISVVDRRPKGIPIATSFLCRPSV